MADEQTPLVDNASSWDQLKLVGANGYYMFLWSAYTSLINPLLPHYMNDLGGDVQHQGLILAAMQVGWIVAFPLLRMSTMSSASLLNFASICFICAPGLIMVLPGTLQLFIANVLKGCGSAIVSVLLTGMMAREIPAESFGKAIGARNALGAAGHCIAAILGGVLYPLGGLQLPMAVLFIASVPLFTLTWVLPGRYLEAQDEQRFKEKPWSSDLQLFREPGILALLTTNFSSWALMSFTFLAVPKLMHENFHLPVFTTMMVWLSWDLLKTGSSYLGGFLADAIAPRQVSLKVFGAQLLFYSIAALSLDFIHSKGTQFLYLSLWGLIFALGTTGNGLFGPAFLKDLVAVEKRSGGERYEELMLIKDFVTTIALLMGPILTAQGLEKVGFRICLLVYTSAGLMPLLHLAFCGGDEQDKVGV
eukprot:CAMPEP_0197640358 /NCGR_PEP_ID=MMETSP1338-20131121/14679_1 /TAXON_ID=43686 ORGANISM="Pelagodinium beii, Strain RCC1491" /NCGR_SAMPLE_ID=MMETSP1338 /ASSEMBLY_ACC=CAM_ASM_000754 /LENGTH=418 /DNA_ID=CAMNT_0043213201 /DNA_START=72 /DNA_END=1328 /DNA_ORIENTATION=-